MTWIRERFVLILVSTALIAVMIVFYGIKKSELRTNAKDHRIVTNIERPQNSHHKENIIPPNKAVDNARSILELQRRDHISQIHMSWAAWLGLVLGLIGTALIGYTLKYTRDAAKAAVSTLIQAQEATRAAKDGVNVAREIGQKENRAYVALDFIEITENKGNGCFGVRTYVKNFGNTPAFNKKLVIDLLIASEELPVTYAHQFVLRGQQSDTPLVPGRGVKQDVFPDNVVTQEQLNELLAGGAHVYIFGRVNYRDVFDNEHVTRFTHYINQTVMEIYGAPIPTLVGNSIS